MCRIPSAHRYRGPMEALGGPRGLQGPPHGPGDVPPHSRRIGVCLRAGPVWQPWRRSPAAYPRRIAVYLGGLLLLFFSCFFLGFCRFREARGRGAKVAARSPHTLGA